MTVYAFDMKPCSRITIGAIGPVGQRTFYLQGIKSKNMVSVILEKQHAQALALGIDELLEEIEEQHPADYEEAPISGPLGLLDPVTPRFRVGRLGLGYDAEDDLPVIFAQEMLSEEETERREPAVGRYWASREQMAALSRVAKDAVAGGRPICPLCGNPIDPAGHFCPPTNGHTKATFIQ